MHGNRQSGSTDKKTYLPVAASISPVTKDNKHLVRNSYFCYARICFFKRFFVAN
jgi:hypothetical protein